MQTALDAVPGVGVDHEPEGEGIVETYTIGYDKNCKGTQGTAIGRLRQGGSRFIATTAKGDAKTVAELADREPLGTTVLVRSHKGKNRFAFDRTLLNGVMGDQA